MISKSLFLNFKILRYSFLQFYFSTIVSLMHNKELNAFN